MDPATSEVIQELVARCLQGLENGEVDPVAEICRERPELGGAVRDRLDKLRGMGLLESAGGELSSFGPYEVLRKLGSGGMGTVYLCEQSGDVQRRVALKVVKRGMDTDEVLARFRLERQTLARMQHPHVAQILDAGATPDGRPYFAMEYVEGVPITQWCDRVRLDTEARTRLFLDVLDAVEHAHLKGVIHRDLKPSNVLVAEVDGSPVVKVIDFGVAKVLDVGGFERTAYTREGMVVGTPEYMSPEQAGDTGAIDIRSDVYSLGVLYYELISGTLPFDPRRLRAKSWDAVQRVLSEEPAAPSSRIGTSADADTGTRATARATAPNALRRRLRGEIDWITLRALRKEPELRYPTVRELAADLERHLDGRPVMAAPPSAIYRLRKLARRHRVAVTVGAAVVTTALVGALGITLAMFRAERNAAEAQELYGTALDTVDDLFFRSGERLRGIPRGSELMFDFYRDARRFYQRLAEVRPDDPELRFRIAATNQTLGGLRVDWRGADDPESLPALQASIAELEALAEESSDDHRYGEELGKARGHLARYHLKKRELAAARAEIHRSITLVEASISRSNRSIRSLDETASAHLIAYDVERWIRKFEPDRAIDLDEAQTHLDRALELRRALVAHAASPAHRRGLVQVLDELAVHCAKSGGTEQALELIEEAEDIAEVLVGEQPKNEFNRRRLAALTNTRGGIAIEMGRPKEAEAAFRKVLELYDELLRGHPNNVTYLEGAAENSLFLGRALFEQSRLAEAAEPLRTGLELVRAARKTQPDHPNLEQAHRHLLECQLWVLGNGVPELEGEIEALTEELRRLR